MLVLLPGSKVYTGAMNTGNLVYVDPATHALVIILSVFLALFLILGIIIFVEILKVMKTVRRIADKAEHVIDSAESVGAIFRNVSGPLSLMKVVANIVESATKHKSKRGGE
jgi:hypothetical protein